MIRGSGGGKGGGSARLPVEASDSLRSRQFARVIDVVTEGEAEGLIDGMKSVYLDDTPLQNEDGTLNFSGVTLIERMGTQGQTHVPGFPAAEAELAVGVEVVQAVPVVRSISNTNATAARVTVSVPQLTSQNMTNGDLNGTSVQIAIDVQTNGGGYVPQVLGAAFNAQGIAISSSGVTTSIASSNFQITVGWVKGSRGYMQLCAYALQYRPASGGAWTTAATSSFSMVYSGGTASKTFDLSLPSNTYEFRVVKTGGLMFVREEGSTVRYSGMSYGGSVSITGANSYKPTEWDTISGKTTSKYQRAYRIELPGDGPWDIRVRRITADSASSALQNKTFWDSYTEIIDAKLTYPNTALFALSVDAEHFNAIPKRGYEMRGIKVRIPSNYDPLTREYSGVWDGTFSIAWTDNPAWCFYDLITNERYGLGAFIDAAQVDKWALYQIAQYCDEMVDEGYGGLEPRFTCSLYLQSQEEAYNVVNYMASIFRGMVYWSGGSITCSQDAPSDPVALFTPANVVGGQFNYAGSSAKARHTVALVSWNDPQDRYRQKVEYVEDAEGIERYGVIQTELVAVGCTSRGQAHRLGRWLLYTERMETETVSFRAGLDGLAVAPGEIIHTSDPVRAGVRMGGRIVSAMVNAVTLDAEVTIDADKTYTLWAVLPDGSVESRAVTTGEGSTNALSVSPDFTTAPQNMSMWVLAASDLVPESWRVISVSEVDDVNAEITAVAYRSDKYDAVENGLILEEIPTSTLTARQAAPTDIMISESLYLVNPAVVGNRITVSWSGSAKYFELRYRRDNENWVTVSQLSTSSIDIAPAEAGHYEFSLIAINAIGSRSVAVTATKEIIGKVAAPSDVTGFSVIKSGGVALAAWTLHPDLDVQVGGRIAIRHSPKVTGATWQDGYVVEYFAGSVVNGLIPLITGTYMIKAQDSSGNWSQNPASFVATEGMVTGFVTVATSAQAPAFGGAKSNLASGAGVLKLDGSVLIDDMIDPVDEWPKLDGLGGISPSGVYAFDAVMDLGTVGTRRFEADITSLSYDTGDTIDDRPAVIDTWNSFDGDIINDCDVTLYAATTNDDPAGAPVWSEWTPFFVSDFTCRAAKFKVEFESGQDTHNIELSELTVHAKEPV